MARLSLRDRFFTPQVARALTSPSGILSLGAGAAVGIVATAPVSVPLAVVGAVVGGTHPPAVLPANCRVSYGLTETGSAVAYDGYPLDGVTFAIVDGTVRVRGDMLLRAYRTDLPEGVELGQLVVVDDRERQLQHAAGRRSGGEKVLLGADSAGE